MIKKKGHYILIIFWAKFINFENRSRTKLKVKSGEWYPKVGSVQAGMCFSRCIWKHPMGQADTESEDVMNKGS